MPDESNTEIFTREDKGNSHFFQISIKAWLALGLIFTVCLHSIAAVVIAVILSRAQPIADFNRIMELLKVTEPLYTMSGMALAYYFGQQKQNQITK